MSREDKSVHGTKGSCCEVDPTDPLGANRAFPRDESLTPVMGGTVAGIVSDEQCQSAHDETLGRYRQSQTCLEEWGGRWGEGGV